MMTRADVTSISDRGDRVVVSCENTLLGMDFDLDVDLVVLPCGIVPTTALDLTINLAYRQGPDFPDLTLFDGFADSNYICFPYETRRTGVYAAGCVRQPMTMDGCMEDAAGAVLKAIQCIEAGDHGVSVAPRSGDKSYPMFNFVRCTQCKRCTEMTMRKARQSQILPAAAVVAHVLAVARKGLSRSPTIALTRSAR